MTEPVRPVPKTLEDLRRARVLTTGLVLADIVGYSKHSSGEQLAIVLSVQDTLRDAVIPAYAASSGLKPGEMIVGFVPTGDGFYMILNPAIGFWAPMIALGLRNLAAIAARRLAVGPLLIRAAAHYGEVMPFVDLSDRLNFVGDAMNDCARLLCGDEHTKGALVEFAGGHDWVVVSERATRELESALGGHERWLTEIDWRRSDVMNFSDKHGKQHSCHAAETSRYVSVAPPGVRRPGVD